MNRLFFILFLSLFSCGRNEYTTTPVQSSGTLSLSTSSTIDIAGKVFEFGDKRHFTDSCVFYFECDCCSSDILFNNDSTFYTSGFCMPGTYVSSGKYRVDSNQVHLFFSGPCVSTSANEVYDLDTTQPEYFHKDTVYSPYKKTIVPFSCGQTSLFKDLSSDDYYSISRKNARDFMTSLQTNDFLNRINQLTKTAANSQLAPPRTRDSFP